MYCFLFLKIKNNHYFKLRLYKNIVLLLFELRFELLFI